MLQIPSVVRTVVIGTIGFCLAATAATAQDQLGGHFGVVFPMVTHVNGTATNIGDEQLLRRVRRPHPLPGR